MYGYRAAGLFAHAFRTGHDPIEVVSIKPAGPLNGGAYSGAAGRRRASPHYMGFDKRSDLDRVPREEISNLRAGLDRDRSLRRRREASKRSLSNESPVLMGIAIFQLLKIAWYPVLRHNTQRSQLAKIARFERYLIPLNDVRRRMG
jgi:hypothetical protein